MNINEAFFESKIKSKVIFGKTIETVYDLSYLLIDFQAIINNLVEMIHDNNDMVYTLSDEKQFIEELHDENWKNNIDVQKCIYNIVHASKPDENIEESVKRLFVELEKNGVINKQFTYDERGIKTAVKDIDRFLGYFMDVRI